ncbi:MAG: hypothetical protein ABIX28_05590 [Vicinamibacterales bacterium]
MKALIGAMRCGAVLARFITDLILARACIVDATIWQLMFPKFAEVIAAVEDLKARGLIQEYAIFGAVAQAFWDEAIPTFDLDVLVLMAGQGAVLTDLGPLYRWADERGYPTQGEHIVIGEIPVQFVPTPTALHEEAVQTAETLSLEGLPLRVVRPEYLIATWLQPPANSHARKERAAKLRESGQVDPEVLADVLARFGLSW